MRQDSDRKAGSIRIIVRHGNVRCSKKFPEFIKKGNPIELPSVRNILEKEKYLRYP